MRACLGLLLSLVLVGCASKPPVIQLDADEWIGLAEIAAHVDGVYGIEGDEASVTTPSSRLVALDGLDRAVFNGAEYRLGRSARRVGNDLFVPRAFFNITLARGFAVAQGRQHRHQARLARMRQISAAPLPEIELPPPTPAKGVLEGRRVVIDAGHGGKDPGAVVKGEVTEASLNLTVADQVASSLRAAGADVITTRDDNSSVSLDRRVEVGKQGEIFVSIHANAFRDSGVQGMEILYRANGAVGPSKRLASAILERMLTATGAKSRGVRQDVRGLRVLRKAAGPAVIVEMGFITNPDERARLADPAYLTLIADAIVEGISDYLQSNPN